MIPIIPCLLGHSGYHFLEKRSCIFDLNMINFKINQNILIFDLKIRNYSGSNVGKSKSLTCKHDDSLISIHWILNSYIKVKERTGYYELYNMCNDRGGSFVFCGAEHVVCKLL